MTETSKPKKKPVGLWLLLGFGALLGLVNFFSRLDPEYRDRVQATKTMEAEKAAEQARINALMPAAAKAAKDTRRIDFGDLSFNAPAADTPDTTSAGYAAWAPAGVKALNDATVRINGFMLPTRVENGHVRECLIMANQLTCCYGKPPRFCDFIIAHVDAPEVAVLQDQPLVFTGRLKVGDSFEGTAWTGFYAMQVQSVGRVQ
jgi:hypothetical protein